MGSIFATSGHVRIAIKKLANWFSSAKRYYKIINKQTLLVLMKKHSDGLLKYFDISSVKFLQKMSQIKSISKKCE